MAASLSVRVQTGASPGSQGPAQSGIDLITADNSVNSLANRQANPITIPSGATSAYSYEKWVKLAVDVAPSNGVTNFKAWMDNTSRTGVMLFGKGSVTSYTTPVTTASSGTSQLPNVQGSAITWDSSSYSSVAQVTQYLVLQLVVLSTASPGSISQITVSYSYDET